MATTAAGVCRQIQQQQPPPKTTKAAASTATREAGTTACGSSGAGDNSEMRSSGSDRRRTHSGQELGTAYAATLSWTPCVVAGVGCAEEGKAAARSAMGGRARCHSRGRGRRWRQHRAVGGLWRVKAAAAAVDCGAGGRAEKEEVDGKTNQQKWVAVDKQTPSSVTHAHQWPDRAKKKKKRRCGNYRE